MAKVVAAIEDELGPPAVIPVPLPRECADGLFTAYWARPEMYLDDEVGANISNFALSGGDEVADGLARVRADLESAAWDERTRPAESWSDGRSTC